MGRKDKVLIQQEAYSYVIEQALGEKLSQFNEYAVNKVANFIRDNFDPSLSINQATALSTAVIIGSMTARSIRADTKAFVSAIDRMSRGGFKIDIVKNSTFFFKGESGGSDVGGKAGGRLAIKLDGGKSSNFDKGDDIGLERFAIKSKGGRLVDKKTGQYLEADRARNSGVGGHGGSYWKLYDKRGNKIGTIDKDGRWLRK